MDREQLINIARQVEEETYVAYGRGIDGSPYECTRHDFLEAAFLYFGQDRIHTGSIEGDPCTLGEAYIISKVQERKSMGEGNAQIDCGNWWLWTILNELEVSRVTK